DRDEGLVARAGVQRRFQRRSDHEREHDRRQERDEQLARRARGQLETAPREGCERAEGARALLRDWHCDLSGGHRFSFRFRRRRRRPASTSRKPARVGGSRPTVGSARKSTRGCDTSARAISSRRRWPPLYVSAGRSIRSASRNVPASSSILAAASRGSTPQSRAWISRFGRPVSERSTTGSWKTTLLTRRAASGSSATSKPASRALPEVGSIVVVSIPTVVDLPAPFGPSRPNTSPAATSKSMPFTASTQPGYVLLS